MRWHAQTRQFSVTEGSKSIVVARRLTAGRLGLVSLSGRFRELSDDYALDRVDFRPGGIVLDVGANIGEVSLICREFGAVVYAFEPDPVEFSCLEANSDSQIYPQCVALWNSTGLSTLFLANETSDSSLFEPVKSEGLATVGTKTLDDWAEENLAPGQIIDLIKLEAEGAEPEILEGASKTLSQVRFISADVGFERPGAVGLESTLPAVANFLLARNFSIVWCGSRRMVLLFKNTKPMLC